MGGDTVKKIFAIDDEPPVLRCLEKALASRGYVLEVTSDPFAGVETLKNDPDIVLALLDVKMPRKNGFEIYREVLQHRRLPVLFVTAYAKSFNAQSDEIVTIWQNEFADGSTDIIYKPFSLEDLFDKVEGLVGPAEELGNDA